MDIPKSTSITEIENRLNALHTEREELLQAASAIEGAHLSTYTIRPAGRHLLTIGAYPIICVNLLRGVE